MIPPHDAAQNNAQFHVVVHIAQTGTGLRPQVLFDAEGTIFSDAVIQFLKTTLLHESDLQHSIANIQRLNNDFT